MYKRKSLLLSEYRYINFEFLFTHHEHEEALAVLVFLEVFVVSMDLGLLFVSLFQQPLAVSISKSDVMDFDTDMPTYDGS